MTEKMYHNSNGFPRLKGKAAEIRQFVHPLIVVFKKHMSVGNQQHRQILLALEMSAEMEAVLDEHAEEYVLSEAGHKRYSLLKFSEFPAMLQPHRQP